MIHLVGTETWLSVTVHEWAREYPVIPFVVACIVFHLFW